MSKSLIVEFSGVLHDDKAQEATNVAKHFCKLSDAKESVFEDVINSDRALRKDLVGVHRVTPMLMARCFILLSLKTKLVAAQSISSYNAKTMRVEGVNLIAVGQNYQRNAVESVFQDARPSASHKMSPRPWWSGTWGL